MKEPLYYKDFPEIKGDGVTNDFDAIRALHERAGIEGRATVAESGKVYYIGRTGGKSIPITTDAYFDGAEVVIDDSDITVDECDKTERTTNVFLLPMGEHFDILSDDGRIKAINAAGGIKRCDKVIDLSLGFKALLMPINNGHIMYKRWAMDNETHGGDPQSEIVIVDEYGNVDERTSLLFDYDHVDRIRVFRIDQAPIKIHGGTFTTIATTSDQHGSYIGFGRGFSIMRSNVTFDGIDHRVLGESDTGASYNGFLYASVCNDIRVLNSKLSGRKYFRQGTYDIGAWMSNGLYFENCTQYNFYSPEGRVYNQDEYWGIIGTNGCKNIEYRDCELTRLDAHAGVRNVTVTGCTMRELYLVGGGTARVENTRLYNNRLIYLREDYASPWRGDVIIKDCTLCPQSHPDYMMVIYAIYHQNDFGFDMMLPSSVTVDGLTVNRDVDVYAIAVRGLTEGCDEKTLPDGSENPNVFHRAGNIKARGTLPEKFGAAKDAPVRIYENFEVIS